MECQCVCTPRRMPLMSPLVEFSLITSVLKVYQFVSDELIYPISLNLSYTFFLPVTVFEVGVRLKVHCLS